MCIEYGPCEDTWSWSSGIRNLTKRPSALELSHLVHSLFLVFRYISFTTWVRNLELFWSVAGWRLWRSARPCREDRRVSFCNSACSISRRHRTVIVLWMDTIVHSLIWRISHSLQCFKAREGQPPAKDPAPSHTQHTSIHKITYKHLHKHTYKQYIQAYT